MAKFNVDSNCSLTQLLTVIETEISPRKYYIPSSGYGNRVRIGGPGWMIEKHNEHISIKIDDDRLATWIRLKLA